MEARWFWISIYLVSQLIWQRTGCPGRVWHWRGLGRKHCSISPLFSHSRRPPLHDHEVDWVDLDFDPWEIFLHFQGFAIGVGLCACSSSGGLTFTCIFIILAIKCHKRTTNSLYWALSGFRINRRPAKQGQGMDYSLLWNCWLSSHRSGHLSFWWSLLPFNIFAPKVWFKHTSWLWCYQPHVWQDGFLTRIESPPFNYG